MRILASKCPVESASHTPSTWHKQGKSHRAIARPRYLPYSVHIHLRIGLWYGHPAQACTPSESHCRINSKLLSRFCLPHASKEVQMYSLNAHQPLLPLYGFLYSSACIIVEKLSVIPQHGRIIQPLGYNDWLCWLRGHRSGQSDVRHDSLYDEQVTEPF